MHKETNAMADIDRIDNDGNITQHRVSEKNPTRTACGARLRMTQAPAGNRPCRNCYPEPRPRSVPRIVIKVPPGPEPTNEETNAAVEALLTMPKAARPLGRRFTSTIDQAILCGAINAHGGEGHPVADGKTLPFFDRDFVLACLRQARPSLTERGQAIAVQLIYTIESM